MNRETRFRAWDGKKMYYWDSVDHPATHLITNTPDKKLFYLPMSWLLGDSNDWVWMQDTGLKDKNGKKIYEGDVVSEETDSRWVVKFIDGAFWFCDGFSKLKTPKDRWTYDWAKDNGYWKSVEIIGNIYENPELLNNKN